ncbi:Ankyrin repeat and KH domain-containing protein mask [Gryllus bimaculatus]|nr:Ankyrin repeat and KH domain-containing protein mask [Gryllus bimaculatus]
MVEAFGADEAGRGQRSLLDVPLHALMAAQAYEAQAAHALSSGGRLLPESGVSRCDLYRRFVELKREMFRQRFGLNDANFENISLVDNFDEIHQNCAMLVLVSDGGFSSVNSDIFSYYLERNRESLMKEKNGIIWLGENGKPYFAHYTYVEYFVASWMISAYRVNEILLKVWETLVSQDAWPGLRQILEHMLSDGLPLHRAALEGSEGALEAALEAGGDPDESDRFGRTALVQAASLGRADAVGALLVKGCDPGRRDALLGWTALRYASACGHLEAAERLLQAGARAHDLVMLHLLHRGAKVNSILENKKTLLIISSARGHGQTVLRLLKYGANANLVDRHERTALHYATMNGYLNVMRSLLEYGANPNAKDAAKKTPLTIACAKGDEQSVLLLLECGADVRRYDANKQTALHIASSGGHVDVVKLLVESNADSNSTDKFSRTPLMLAAQHGHVQCVAYLLRHGADIRMCDTSNETVIHHAATAGHLEIVTLVVESEAEPDGGGGDDASRSLLMLAAEVGCVAPVRFLLQHGADVHRGDSQLRTALHYAARGGHLEVMSLLVVNNADVDWQDREGVSPLMLAAHNGHVNAVLFLLHHMAAVRLGNAAGTTALHYAVESGHSEIMKILVDHDADVDVVDQNHGTPLMIAARNSDLSSVEFLLEQGANIHLRNALGRSALHCATYNCHHELMRLLVEQGADSGAEDRRQTTPLMVACERGDATSVSLLLGHGAEVRWPQRGRAAASTSPRRAATTR